MKKDTRTEKRKTGDIGEDVSCMFLKKHKFEILERNYSEKCGEIDIVAKKNNVLHFIEVKTVAHETGYSPEENIHSRKRKRMARTIQVYLSKKNISSDTEIQVASIAVFLNMGTRKAKVRFTENIIL